MNHSQFGSAWTLVLLFLSVSATATTTVYLDPEGKFLKEKPKGVPSVLAKEFPWGKKPFPFLKMRNEGEGGLSVDLVDSNKEPIGMKSPKESSKSAPLIEIVNADGPGEGFNDPTPATPVGGNSGTTIGEQRLIAFQYAADIWAALLDINVPVKVEAEFNPKTCSPTSAVLGSAGPASVRASFSGAPIANTWYPIALANQLYGSDLSPGAADISAEFNSSIDNNDSCLSGTDWYYGIDGNPTWGDIDLVSVLLHEFCHGLGFLTVADEQTGAKLGGRDDVFLNQLRDESLGKNWNDPTMSDGDRAASAIDTNDLTWTGAGVNTLNGGLSNGVHASGNVEMYAPNPLQLGSSVSHFSTRLYPNALMEPSYTSVNHNPTLSAALLYDLGWTEGMSPTPTSSPTSTSTYTPTHTLAPPTFTPTSTPSHTATATSTSTSTNTPTESPTHTPTETSTATQTWTPSRTVTPTATHTPTDSPTPSPTPTWTPSPTFTFTQEPSPTSTETPSDTATSPPTVTPTEESTHVPTDSETPTETPTATTEESPTPTLVESSTHTPTQTTQAPVRDFDVEPVMQPDGVVDDADLLMWYQEVVHEKHGPKILFEFSMHWMENKKVSKKNPPPLTSTSD